MPNGSGLRGRSELDSQTQPNLMLIVIFVRRATNSSVKPPKGRTFQVRQEQDPCRRRTRKDGRPTTEDRRYCPLFVDRSSSPIPQFPNSPILQLPRRPGFSDSTVLHSTFYTSGPTPATNRKGRKTDDRRPRTEDGRPTMLSVVC